MFIMSGLDLWQQDDVPSNILDSPGIYTEQVFVPFGPGYYTVTARLTTTHGLVYEDVFSLGYNVDFASGLAWIVLVPLIVAAIPLLSIRRKANWQEDDDFSSGGGASGRILAGEDVLYENYLEKLLLGRQSKAKRLFLYLHIMCHVPYF